MTAGDPSPWAAVRLTVLAPEGVSGTITIHDQHAGLKMAVAARSGAHHVGDERDALSTTEELADRPCAYICENS